MQQVNTMWEEIWLALIAPKITSVHSKVKLSLAVHFTSTLSWQMESANRVLMAKTARIGLLSLQTPSTVSRATTPAPLTLCAFRALPAITAPLDRACQPSVSAEPILTRVRDLALHAPTNSTPKREAFTVVRCLPATTL